MSEQALFLAALEKYSPAERQAFLDEACGQDAALRARVEQLLEADARAPGLLVHGPHPQEATADYPAPTAPGTVIAGRYKLLEEIGEGGMGTVWVAEQTEPVRRKVALKLIKPGMDSKSVLARFEAERQALAVMDHPNIAKVLDGGLTETGRPFFVMEYVKGVPITEYCDATRLSVPERLRLFAQVCQAVQHAHQKGIIHRDLKPSNILVAPYDDRPVPKVIDFGLAKALHQPLTDRTLHTAHGTVLGTPLYMSPEQAQLNNLDVDTRSDIYTLGVLLYELLTGTTPLERRRLEEAAWDEVRRIIREEEPPRPSTRLSSSQTLPALAASRQTEPARLTKMIRGDLDWIVMKALEKDRGRRYESASSLAVDLQCYLAGEPVLAAPPSARYRLGKFIRRHRTALAVAAALIALLVAGATVSTWQAVRATRAETAARSAEQEAQAQKAAAEQAAADAKAANEQAQKRLRQIEKANDLLGSIFANLNPQEVARAGRPLQAILVEKLDRAVERLEGEAIGDPLVVAAMQNKFGRSLISLGEPGKALVLLEKARATQQARLGPDHLDTLDNMYNLALAYHAAGKLDLALPLIEKTLKLRKGRLGPDHPKTLTTMNNLAVAYQDAGKLDLARPLFAEALKLAIDNLGPDHPDTRNVRNNLDFLRNIGAAEERYRVKLAQRGPDDIDTLLARRDLAQLYVTTNRLDEAERILVEVLDGMNTRPNDDPIRVFTIGLLRNCLKTRERTMPDSWRTFRCQSRLGGALLGLKKYTDAEPLLLAGYEGLKMQEAKLPPEAKAGLTEAAERLVQLYEATDKKDEASKWRQEREALRPAAKGPQTKP